MLLRIEVGGSWFMRKQKFCVTEGRQVQLGGFLLVQGLVKEDGIIIVGGQNRGVFLGLRLNLVFGDLPGLDRWHSIKIYQKRRRFRLRIFRLKRQLIYRLGQMQKEKKDPQQCFQCFFFTFAVLAVSSGISLAVLLVLWGYFGFDNENPLRFTNCSSPYFTFKLSSLNTVHRIIFISTSVSASSLLVGAVLSLSWLIKKCSGERISSCSRTLMGTLISLGCLGSFVPLSYNLTFIVEGSNCTKIVDNEAHCIVFIALSIATLTLSLVMWLMLLCTKDSRGQKYQELSSLQTEQKQEVLGKREYFREEGRVREVRVERQGREQKYRRGYPDRDYLQETKEYMNKRDKQEVEPRFVARSKQENPVLSLHPSLNINNDRQYQYSRFQQDKQVSYKDYLIEDNRALRDVERSHFGQYNQQPMPNHQYRERNQRSRSRGRHDYKPRRNRNRRGRREDIYREQDQDDYYERQPAPRLHKQFPPKTLREEAILRALTRPS